MKKLNKVYLHTGSNIGDKKARLLQALVYIEAEVGTILKTSALYQTEAWGLTNQDDFFNQAVLVNTEFKPLEVLNKLKEIEIKMGRIKTERWTARIIDIDILFWDNELVNEPSLTIPHPHIPERNFVLIPMLEIAPYLVHPLLNKNIEELYLESKDTQEVILLEN